MDRERYEAGKAVRASMLGALPAVDDFIRPFQDLVLEYCWGGIWARPGLERKTRSLVNLAMLAALGRTREFAIHVRGALSNGCTQAEIQEVLLQVAVYAGVPAAATAFRSANEVVAGLAAAAQSSP